MKLYKLKFNYGNHDTSWNESKLFLNFENAKVAFIDELNKYIYLKCSCATNYKIYGSYDIDIENEIKFNEGDDLMYWSSSNAKDGFYIYTKEWFNSKDRRGICSDDLSYITVEEVYTED